jgi:hypothetical protein
MTTGLIRRFHFVLPIAMTLAVAVTASADVSESKRLARAKDYIAEEQWIRAVEELRAQIADPKESGRDEGLYWLAHSLNQAGDPAAAVETIARLERQFPKSLWVKPAGALRIQIAVRLGRNDVLWWTAVPPPPPPRPASAPRPPDAAAPVAPRPATATVPPPLPPPAPEPPSPARPATPAPPVGITAVRPSSVWVSDHSYPDPDLRVQALGYLMRTDAEKVIPLLRQIALEPGNPGPATQALFVLAQSDRRDARETVVQVARNGPEQIRVAAIRELGRFGGPDVSGELLMVYKLADASEVAVKRQVVRALGERAEKNALLTIVQAEKDSELRRRAILTLGTAGGSEQLWTLYARASAQMKRPIIMGLFNARAEEQLIRIAEGERDAELRRELLDHLRLLGTPKAREYLQKVSQNR